ncbi:MAG: transcriptional repressor, partial [Psychroserpens sp.]|nr:transcriptional repressor [Psychroserpens sp.]
MSIIRKTKSVKMLLEIFESTKSALSVVDLVEQLKSEMNKTTVYRILERLENEGVLHSFNGINGLKWYAKCS